MLLLMENGPLKRVSFSYLNSEVVKIVFVPKIWLKTPFEGYITMMIENLVNDFGIFPIVKANQSLGGNQPFVVSHENTEDNIFNKV